jgi:hypothetical protein
MTKKTAALAFRVSDDLKRAMEKAANDDSRSISSMVEKILASWLRSEGYLRALAAPGAQTKKAKKP